MCRCPPSRPRCSPGSALARRRHSPKRCWRRCGTPSGDMWLKNNTRIGEKMMAEMGHGREAAGDSKRGSTAQPCLLVIFGGSGDLARRKLIPAVYNLLLDGMLPANYAVLGLGHSPLSDEEFR